MESNKYNQIKNIINNSISNMLNEIDSKNIEYKITILKKIINESIAEHKTGTVSLSSKVNSMFSGRGRAWCKVEKSEDLFYRIIDKLASCNSNNTSIDTSNLIDLFNVYGFAWMRYSGSNINNITFNLRYRGSKVEECIPFKISYNELSQIKNLEGVPHNINLESGDFSLDITKKEIDNIEVSKKDLNNLGIQTLEDFIS